MLHLKLSSNLDSQVIASETTECLESLRIERERLGVEFDSVVSFIDMVADGDVKEVLEIIGKLARLEK